LNNSAINKPRGIPSRFSFFAEKYKLGFSGGMHSTKAVVLSTFLKVVPHA
jgi:hypothetical protein